LHTPTVAIDRLPFSSDITRSILEISFQEDALSREREREREKESVKTLVERKMRKGRNIETRDATPSLWLSRFSLPIPRESMAAEYQVKFIVPK